ncbi:MAG: nickel pincer cofactor biosynthesis protein LarC [Erysipelotrichaceae bacterium]|nr:nickel pincer cofactor biosynthesis protein LarC [Erysipelotrichaceae bacterium]
MKVLYIECGMGCAGDMLLGALVDTMENPDAFVDQLNKAGIPCGHYQREVMKKLGITGTKMHVLAHEHEEGEHHDHHHHHGMPLHEIDDIIASLHVPEKVKEDATAVYHLIAEAESRVHNEEVGQLHFHEVGMLDGICDVVGVSYALYELQAERIHVSAVASGNGTVHCAHGILPVPAPATAILLEGMPWYHGNIPSELTTPTGAALLKYFGDTYGEDPVMTIHTTGYGFGTKEFEQLNCVRVFVGEQEENGRIVELTCNMDDMSPEGVGHAMGVLLEAGALDVYTINANMKKNRPGLVFTCMCRETDAEKMRDLMFLHLTTLGIRQTSCLRHSMHRNIRNVSTDYGNVRIKYSSGYGVTREKIEYEDLARISKETGKSIEQVREEIRKKMK